MGPDLDSRKGVKAGGAEEEGLLRGLPGSWCRKWWGHSPRRGPWEGQVWVMRVARPPQGRAHPWRGSAAQPFPLESPCGCRFGPQPKRSLGARPWRGRAGLMAPSGVCGFCIANQTRTFWCLRLAKCNFLFLREKD